jgi:FMN phosphatase YigB (HAD superfamily)
VVFPDQPKLELISSPWVGLNWQHLLITDIDNTLFDFGLYAEAGLRRVVPLAASLLGISQAEAITELRAAFREFSSIEIQYAYESLPSLKERVADDRYRLSRELASAFWDSATQDIEPYPDVLTTMEYLWRNGTAIVAVSDAPMEAAWRKLRRLGLLRYLSGVVAVKSEYSRQRPIALRQEDIPDFGDPRETRHLFYHRLSPNERKPSALAYERVLERILIDHSRVTVIGDSPLKDLVPARELGLSAYWAAYGERQRHLEATLQAVTPFEPPEALGSQAKEASDFGTLDTFRELLDVIKLDRVQLRLPLDEANS